MFLTIVKIEAILSFKSSFKDLFVLIEINLDIFMKKLLC